MWCLFLLVFLALPFFVGFKVKFNVLRLKGVLTIIIFKFKIIYKLRVKNGYVYLYYKNKEKRIKLTKTNFNFLFFINVLKQLYFREHCQKLCLQSNFGYSLDAKTTAVVNGYLLALFSSVFAKIKNNKKSAHIFVNIEPKYNEDICNVSLENNMSISIFDILYSVVYAVIYSWGKYEGNKRKS